MNHAKVQSRMADYLDGDLALDERALVDAHLDNCAGCARDLSELQGTVALLRSLPAPVTPSDLADNVIARLRADGGKATRRDLREVLADWFSAPRLVVPATALAAAAGVFLLSGGQFAPISIEQPAQPGAVQKAATAPLQVARSEARAPSAVVPTPAPRPPHGVVAEVATAEPQLARVQTPAPVSNGTFQPSAFASSRTLRVAGSNSGGLQPLPAAATSQVASAEHLGRERRLDDRLALLQRNPEEFAAWLGRRSVAERDLWLEQFARYANERDISGAVLQALRSSKDPRLESAAVQFAAELGDTQVLEPTR